MNLSRILLFIVIANLSGCAGCSKSGRESLRNRAAKANKTEGSNDHGDEKEFQRKAQSDNRNEKENVTTNRSQRKSNLSLSELYDEQRKGVFLVYSTDDGSTGSQGSGFFVSGDGLAVSNEHVFGSYNSHYVKLYDGTVLSVNTIIKKSKDFDYVVFQVDTEGQEVHSLSLAKSLPNVGEDILAIGNPRGLEQTLSTGIISGYRESNKFIQTTAEITNGSSGGPLFNMSGEVVGITTAGYGEANLNFAINILLVDIVSDVR